MKKKLSLLVILVAGAIAVNAQGGGGGFQRRTVEERVQSVHHKIDSAFKLDATKIAQADSAFAAFYRATDKVRDEVMASANGDRDAMRQQMQEKNQPLIDARDKELKAILGDDNFKTWKEIIEPSMRRGPGGPPRQ